MTKYGQGIKIGDQFNAGKSKKQSREEMKTVLAVENKSVVDSSYCFNIALVLTPPASHNF